MHLIIVLAVLISAAGYLGLVPETANIVDFPLPLVAAAVISAGMAYALAKI